MNRRTRRRRYAILGALVPYGELTATSICLRLHYPLRQLGRIDRDLEQLEHEGYVTTEWDTTTGTPVRIYQLTKREAQP